MTAHASLRWLLDTSVISELARPEPSAAVVTRFAAHAHEAAIPMVVWHELLFGVLRLPDGRRKDALLRFVHTVPGALPKLPYDESAARAHAVLRVSQERRGHPLAEPDAQIAAHAIGSGLTLVTRNLRDFQGIDDIQLQNWFNA